MELMKVIDNRMSIRSYLDKPVDDELIFEILMSGHKAPSGGNIQPWEFVIVKSNDNKRNIVDTTFVGNNENSDKKQEWMMEAPVFIVVCANVERSKARYGEKAEKSLIYLDCSACIENMLLSVVDLGLASCYISGFREAELIKTMNLPDGILPIGILPIGYPNIVPEKRKKRDLSEAVHYEYYGNKTK